MKTKFSLQFPVACDVCGEEGVGDINTAAASWDSEQTVRHRDPRVCNDILKAKMAKLEDKLTSVGGGAY